MTTVYNCFRKSSVIQPQTPNLPTAPAPDLLVLYEQTQHAGQIRDMMTLNNFLTPVDENVVEAGDDRTDLSAIIANHLDQEEFIEAAEQSDEEEPLPPPSTQ